MHCCQMSASSAAEVAIAKKVEVILGKSNPRNGVGGGVAGFKCLQVRRRERELDIHVPVTIWLEAIRPGQECRAWTRDCEERQTGGVHRRVEVEEEAIAWENELPRGQAAGDGETDCVKSAVGEGGDNGAGRRGSAEGIGRGEGELKVGARRQGDCQERSEERLFHGDSSLISSLIMWQKTLHCTSGSSL